MSHDDAPGDTVRCRVVVSGRVQGVYFRDSCRQMAWRLDVRGWVRNAGDGTVEAVMEGDRVAVGALIEWCREGPPRAQVTRVVVTDEEPIGEGRFRVEGW